MQKKSNDGVRIAELEVELANIKKKYLHARAENNRLRQHVDFLHEELVQNKKFFNQLKSLLLGVDRFIFRKIESLRKGNFRAQDELLSNVKPGNSTDQLLRTARQADIIVFYNQSNSRQILYKLFLNAYNLLRSAVRAMLRSGIKIFRKLRK